jgi:hypothetical protein
VPLGVGTPVSGRMTRPWYVRADVKVELSPTRQVGLRGQSRALISCGKGHLACGESGAVFEQQPLRGVWREPQTLPLRAAVLCLLFVNFAGERGALSGGGVVCTLLRVLHARRARRGGRRAQLRVPSASMRVGVDFAVCNVATRLLLDVRNLTASQMIHSERYMLKERVRRASRE